MKSPDIVVTVCINPDGQENPLADIVC